MDHLIPHEYLGLSDATFLAVRAVYGVAAAPSENQASEAQTWAARINYERSRIYHALQIGDLFAEASRSGQLSGRLALSYWVTEPGIKAMESGETEEGLRVVVAEEAFKRWLDERKQLKPAPTVEDGHVVISEYVIDAKDLRACAPQLGLSNEDVEFFEREMAGSPTDKGELTTKAEMTSRGNGRAYSEVAEQRYNRAIELGLNPAVRGGIAKVLRKIQKEEGPQSNYDSIKRDVGRVRRAKEGAAARKLLKKNGQMPRLPHR